MKKYFGLYFMYLAYLLILGQGCSAIDGVDHVLSVPLPNLSNAPSIKLKAPSSLSFSQAPKENLENSESQLLATITSNKAPMARKSLDLLTINKDTNNNTKSIKKLEALKPIEKSFEIEFKETNTPEKPVKDVSKSLKVVSLNKQELTYKTGIEHYGFKLARQPKISSWQESMASVLDHKLAQLEKLGETLAKSENNSQEDFAVDSVSSIQSASTKTDKTYDPADPKMLAMFDRPQVDLNAIVAKKEVGKQIPDLNKEKVEEELVLIDYSKDNDLDENKIQEDLSNEAASLAKVAATPVSGNVSRVIQREMGPNPNREMGAALSMASQVRDLANAGTNKPQPSHGAAGLKNSLGLYPLEAAINDGIKGEVPNFSFVPSYDTNQSLEDLGEGFITLDYSLQNSTGLLRGTLLKNYFIRTSFEIPLGSEYSKFEIPMITQESLSDYLDKNNLEGYGGYYLADLGEYLEDVELEKGNTGYQNTYEFRLLLDENFKEVKQGKNYRYVLFIGVVPGNVTVRYLGINGQETSKITFIAPDELLYDFSQLERPLDLEVETKLQNTLGKTLTDLNVEPSKFINFVSGEEARQVSPANYVLTTPWKIKGSRSYFELSYLSDSVFVGLDSNKTLELPSQEFIGETLRAFNMDGLNKECLLQINFPQKVRDFKILGESARGPAVFDMAFLDEDGVFSAELSPISNKVFLLGNEDGVFNIKVKYENGNEDYLRTYCSISTYLLEQL